MEALSSRAASLCFNAMDMSHFLPPVCLLHRCHCLQRLNLLRRTNNHDIYECLLSQAWNPTPRLHTDYICSAPSFQETRTNRTNEHMESSLLEIGQSKANPRLIQGLACYCCTSNCVFEQDAIRGRYAPGKVSLPNGS